MRYVHIRKRQTIALIGLGLTLALIIACGAAAPAEPESAAEPMAEPAPAQVESAEPTVAPVAEAEPAAEPESYTPEGTINVGQKEIGRFIAHPSQQQNPQIFVVGTPPITEGLLHFTADREVVGKLAESWEISEDATTWTFNLRQGVQFHKGYGEMTAEDVVYSYRQWPLSKHRRAGRLLGAPGGLRGDAGPLHRRRQPCDAGG